MFLGQPYPSRGKIEKRNKIKAESRNRYKSLKLQKQTHAVREKVLVEQLLDGIRLG